VTPLLRTPRVKGRSRDVAYWWNLRYSQSATGGWCGTFIPPPVARRSGSSSRTPRGATLPHPAMDQHLTVKEAVRLTGKSESTIKRLIREIVNDPGHPDRGFILPPHDDVERRRQAMEPYVWKLDRQLLLRRFLLLQENLLAKRSHPGIRVAAIGDRHARLLRDAPTIRIAGRTSRQEAALTSESDATSPGPPG
jgi:hypothetical protein